MIRPVLALTVVALAGCASAEPAFPGMRAGWWMLRFENAEPSSRFFSEPLGEIVPIYPLEAICLSAEQARRPLLVGRAAEAGVQCDHRLFGDPAGADWRVEARCAAADGTRFRVTAEFEGLIGAEFVLRQTIKADGATEPEVAVARAQWIHGDCSRDPFAPPRRGL